MEGAVDRMQELIHDLLTYSRVTTDAKPFEEISLNQVIEDVVADLQVRIEETEGRVEVGELPSLYADAVQIRRLLQNLIDNGLKFHKAGQPPVVNVSGDILESDEKLCRVIVKDNGVGFEKKYLEKVFAPFQRLHGRSEYEGTGIGMATCRKIVERHNGDITAESEPDKGSTFIITLPIEQPKEKTK
jgi:light-regulated signal transduction histidine kinase (bacteriophytochrome)